MPDLGSEAVCGVRPEGQSALVYLRTELDLQAGEMVILTLGGTETIGRVVVGCGQLVDVPTEALTNGEVRRPTGVETGSIAPTTESPRLPDGWTDFSIDRSNQSVLASDWELSQEAGSFIKTRFGTPDS